MTRPLFYDAGRPVCIEAEPRLAGAPDPGRCEVESVHPGENAAGLAEAQAAGVRPVPALVIDGAACRIGHGADLSAREPR